MKTKSQLPILLLFVALLSGCIGGNSNPVIEHEYTVSGKVIDIETAEGVEGVTVIYDNKIGAVSSKDGTFKVTGLKGSATLEMWKENVRLTHSAVQVSPSHTSVVIGATTNEDFLLVPSQYSTISEAIANAATGDTVIIGPGTYYETITFGGKNITVCSINPDDPGIVASTKLDGGYSGSVVSFVNNEGPEAVLKGLTIQYGTGRYFQSNLVGGGIAVVDASPTIRQNRIINNQALAGAGLFVGNLYGERPPCTPHIFDNIFEDNSAGEGGAIFIGGNSEPVISNNKIISNLSDSGGGIAINAASATITENEIKDNRSPHFGAGVHMSFLSSYGQKVVLHNNVISGNRADRWGGGVFFSYSSASTPHAVIISDNEISNNQAEWGGGIYAADNLTIANNVLRGNIADLGGGLYLDAAVILDGNLFDRNTGRKQGGGIYISAPTAFVDDNFDLVPDPMSFNEFSQNNPNGYWYDLPPRASMLFKEEGERIHFDWEAH